MSTIHVNADGSATEQHQIVPSVSIDNLVQLRAAALERYDQAIALLREANDLARAAGLGGQRFVIEELGRHEQLLEPDGRDLVRRSLDAGGWQYLMIESGLRSFMDAKARQEWDANIVKGGVPELTKDTIAATFEAMHALRGELFERGVIEVFRRLSWSYKTNSPVKFGKRIIVTNLFTVYNNSTTNYHAYLRYETTNELDDLARVFCGLDGAPQPDHRQATCHFIGQAQRDNKTEIERPYFSLRWYRKGTGHLTFKRPDLVEAMNRILAKHHPNALPATR